MQIPESVMTDIETNIHTCEGKIKDATKEVEEKTRALTDAKNYLKEWEDRLASVQKFLTDIKK